MTTRRDTATAASLLARCEALGIGLQPDGGRLRFHGRDDDLTPELAAKLQAHAAELLEIIGGGCQDGDAGPVANPSELPGDGPQDAGPSDIDAGEWQEHIDPDGRRCLVRSDAADVEIIDARPCPVCGGIVFWWDVAGGAHCERCSPATPTGQRLRQRAAELQPRPVTVPRTWPAAVPTEIIADPIRACSDCGRPRSVVPGQPGRPAGLCFNCWSKRA